MTLIRSRRDMFPTLNGLFDDFFNQDESWGTGNAMANRTSLPAVNVKESEDSYNIELAAPGMKKKDFNIELEDNVLTISADKKEQETEEDENYTRREFLYTSFLRKFTLPESADGEKIKASYTDGVLDIFVPKKEEAKPRPPKNIDVS
ncbi:Hsp20/alpha crystallin family protein [Mangrovivirga cuniculi]|uniref:Heat-shock protein n=1 Tax=Mangrovivirga cuniculi TaxID=2715131 RepID=A0A4D7K8K3_9BACT|nr:Hsp20/alpha crystallin family protein [Mangrovivirga cuniculi]QCK17054.1 heat-shock protein [Mangrovivirga cuniculi]